MQNESRLYSQVAAETGVDPERAMVACYLLGLSRQGKSLNDAAALLRKDRCDVRGYARDWGISFTDYVTNPRPLCLMWLKAKRGLWELRLDGLLIASAVADGSGGYIASEHTHSTEHRGSSAEIAIRRLSIEIERRSVEMFGVDDVVIWMDDRGEHQRLAPKLDCDPGKLRAALAA